MTLVCRYKLEGNRISERQTLTIDNSAYKWKAYNKGKFDPKTGESKSSNFSGLRCLTSTDYNDIVCYSGKLKKNSTWVKFIKETINA